MPGGMQTFVCRHCGHTERGRGVLEVWHPCTARPSKTGRPQMTEMERETSD